VEALAGAIPGIGGGGEAAILEGLGQAVPAGVELAGPAASFAPAEAAAAAGPAAAAATPGIGAPGSITGNATADALLPQNFMKGILDPVGKLVQGNKTLETLNMFLNPMSAFMSMGQGGGAPEAQAAPLPQPLAIEAPDLGGQNRVANLIRAFQLQG